MGKNKSDYSILAVDDSDIMMSLIKILLENEGYKFSSADCATLAIELINNQHFDLILMDIEMPGMTGVELLKELGKQGLMGNTKVVMLTGKTDVEHVKECLQLGATSYILKPFDHAAMGNRIWEILQSG